MTPVEKAAEVERRLRAALVECEATDFRTFGESLIVTIRVSAIHDQIPVIPIRRDCCGRPEVG